MDKKFHGERDIWSTAEETPETVTFRRGASSQPQPPQMQQLQQPESSHQRANGFLNDLKTLESSFCGLSFSDSTLRQNGHHPDRFNPVINGGSSGGLGGGPGLGGSAGLGGLGGSGGHGGGGYMFPQSASYHQRELEGFNQMQQRDGAYRYGYDGTMYGSSSSFASRNRYPWDGMNSPLMGYGGYNHDQAMAMMNGREITILSMAKDQVMSEHVLKMISQSTKETIDVIFNALIGQICDLMVDPFASDVVKKLLGKCSFEQIAMIVDMVTQEQSQFVNICFDSLGSAAIELLLLNIHRRGGDEQVSRMVATISSVALRLAKTSHAKDIILACFSLFTYNQCRLLVEVVARHCYQIGIDQHGCYMLQLCVYDQSRKVNYEVQQRMICEIITHSVKLCLNCYGNYVVQFILELDNLHVTRALVLQLVGSYAHLSRNKYGSHAVQKLLRLRCVETRLIINDLLAEMDSLLLDPYGNYVIQTAWFVSEVDVRQVLMWHIERNIRLMRCNKFGNKILEKLHL
ncbi:putative pumilio homolog 13 [Capsella rubella]|nr:putative pumilio homolog 13 [Capsella rubella]